MVKSEREKLKSCPFCGLEIGVCCFDFGRRWQVGCGACSVSFDIDFATEAEAIGAWNKRADEADIIAGLLEAAGAK